MKAKGFKVVIEELKQRISAKYRQNKLSQCNQKKAFYQELGGKVTPAQVSSDAEEVKEFWSIL